MNSPDLTRLATALAKIDDEDIIELLLSTYFPKPEPAPVVIEAHPVQGELLGHIQDRKPKYRMTRVPKMNKSWTSHDEQLLMAMHRGGSSDEEIAQRLGRSVRSIGQRRSEIKHRRNAS